MNAILWAVVIFVIIAMVSTHFIVALAYVATGIVVIALFWGAWLLLTGLFVREPPNESTRRNSRPLD